MKRARCKLSSITPYSQSRHIDELEHPKLPKETPEAYEKRCWRARIHRTSSGNVEIPETCFLGAVRETAKRLQIPIPGKKMQMYTKSFEAGIAAIGGIELKIKADDVPSERLFVPSNGRPGGGTRVWRWFPKIEKWSGEITFVILDDVITEDVFRRVLTESGLLVGIGRFRPQNRGFYGRYRVDSLVWSDDSAEAAE
jgi:hypothetical protein